MEQRWKLTEPHSKVAAYARDGIIGVPFWDTPWWSGSERVQDEIRRAVKVAVSGDTYAETLSYWLADGTERTVDFRMTPAFGDNGEVVYVCPSGFDITDRQCADEALAEKQRQLTIGIDLAKFGLGQIDYPEDVIHLTAEAASLYGLGDQPRTIARPELHAIFDPKDNDAIVELIDDCIARGSGSTMKCEHRVTLPDGSVRWLDVRKQIFSDESTDPPTPTNGILAARDITDQKQVELEQLATSIATSRHHRQYDQLHAVFTPTEP